jgi:hypothetical protein
MSLSIKCRGVSRQITSINFITNFVSVKIIKCVGQSKPRIEWAVTLKGSKKKLFAVIKSGLIMPLRYSESLKRKAPLSRKVAFRRHRSLTLTIKSPLCLRSERSLHHTFTIKLQNKVSKTLQTREDFEENHCFNIKAASYPNHVNQGKTSQVSPTSIIKPRHNLQLRCGTMQD